MKNPRPAKSASSTQEKISGLRSQLESAKKRTESARAAARKAKVELKRVRKAFKQAKRTAKEERKHLKTLKKMLAAAASAIASPKGKEKSASKGKSSEGRTPEKSTRSSKRRPLETTSAALSLRDQSSSGSTLGITSPPIEPSTPLAPAPREEPRPDSPTSA